MQVERNCHHRQPDDQKHNGVENDSRYYASDQDISMSEEGNPKCTGVDGALEKARSFEQHKQQGGSEGNQDQPNTDAWRDDKSD